jgi:hypothetical protein
MKVYAAFRTSPDYHSSGAFLVSIHLSKYGAINALYPDKQYEFSPVFSRRGVWTGPDGFGEVREIEVLA